MPYKYTKQLAITLTLTFLFLVGCDKKAPEISEEIKLIIGDDLKSWISNSPFDGKFNLESDDEDYIQFDNREQVWPFMGKFNNENDDLGNTYDYSYKREVAIYKDPKWGNSFVYSELLYKQQELFVEKSYSVSGNVLLSGMSAIHDSYSADLSETKLVVNNSDYKTAIYWVQSNHQLYLSGFFQKQNLIFQFGFPCSKDDIAKGINKIKEINKALNLNIEEWSHLTEDDLAVNKTAQSFWKDPYYYAAYYSYRNIPELSIKISNTNFVRFHHSPTYKADYIFGYKHAPQKYQLTFKGRETSISEDQFKKEHKAFKSITTNGISSNILYITSEKVVDSLVMTEAEVYYKQGNILKISSRYPKEDLHAKEQLSDILINLRVHSFY